MRKVLESYLGQCVRRAIRRERPRVIAIAGSVGKSSTKTAIGIALGADDPTLRVLVSPKNFNNELGVPLTVFRCDMPGRSIVSWIRLIVRATLTAVGLKRIGAQILVLEFGTDRPGDIAHLCSIAPPDVAVLTAISPEHTEYFKTVEDRKSVV